MSVSSAPGPTTDSDATRQRSGAPVCHRGAVRSSASRPSPSGPQGGTGAPHAPLHLEPDAVLPSGDMGRPRRRPCRRCRDAEARLTGVTIERRHVAIARVTSDPMGEELERGDHVGHVRTPGCGRDFLRAPFRTARCAPSRNSSNRPTPPRDALFCATFRLAGIRCRADRLLRARNWGVALVALWRGNDSIPTSAVRPASNGRNDPIPSI